MIYDLKFRAILDEQGAPNGTAVGIYRNITDRYLKDLKMERYQQIVNSSERVTFQYDVRQDLMIFYTSMLIDADYQQKEYHLEHDMQQLQEGEVCPESDIPVLYELLSHGAKNRFKFRCSATAQEKRAGVRSPVWLWKKTALPAACSAPSPILPMRKSRSNLIVNWNGFCAV